MEYEQYYRLEPATKSSCVSNRNTFDQFTDSNHWSPDVFISGDSPIQTASKSSFQTTTTESKSANKKGNDWAARADLNKCAKKPEHLSLNEQMRKFSNRYLYESVQCSRYDLMHDYFNKEKPISELLKTPQLLVKNIKKPPPPPTNRHILVQRSKALKNKEMPQTKNLKQQHSNRITCNIDGSPWKPKVLLDRSECSWYRKHCHDPLVEPVRRYKPPNLLQPSNLVRLSKVGRRDTNSFFKPVH